MDNKKKIEKKIDNLKKLNDFWEDYISKNKAEILSLEQELSKQGTEG